METLVPQITRTGSSAVCDVEVSVPPEPNPLVPPDVVILPGSDDGSADEDDGSSDDEDWLAFEGDEVFSVKNRRRIGDDMNSDEWMSPRL